MISDAEIDRLHDAIRSLGYTTNRQSREIAELLATLNLAGVVGGDAVDAARYRKLCQALNDAEPVSNEASAIRNIIDDSINLGAACLEMHLDTALAKGNDHGN